jgi:hypothetical protein
MRHCLAVALALVVIGGAPRPGSAGVARGRDPDGRGRWAGEFARRGMG